VTSAAMPARRRENAFISGPLLRTSDRETFDRRTLLFSEIQIRLL
jgi:hypothetical protein